MGLLFIGIISVGFIMTLISARKYLLQLLSWIRFTPFRILIGGIFYFAIIIQIGAVDLGTIIYIVVVLSSSMLVYPIYIRDKLFEGKQYSNYSGMIFMAISVQTIGLYVFPDPVLLFGVTGSNGTVLLYMILSIAAGILGYYIYSDGLIRFESQPGDNQNESTTGEE